MKLETEVYQILRKHRLPLKKREELIVDLLEFIENRDKEKNYGTEVTIEELKGHYEMNFMTSDRFIDLVKEWHKSEVKELK